MRRVLWFFAGLSLLSTVGCAICASPHDCKYAAYGGLRERTDHVNGRVASVIDPASEINRAAWSGQSGHSTHAHPAEVGLPAAEAPETGLPGTTAPEAAGSAAPPSIMPEEAELPRSPGASPSGLPESGTPSLDLPEGPQPSDGETLPELPGDDSIELPEAGRTTKRSSGPQLSPMHYVLPASVDLSSEATAVPLGTAFDQPATPTSTADGRPIRSIMKRPVR